jgi:hypothetical protein
MSLNRLPRATCALALALAAMFLPATGAQAQGRSPEEILKRYTQAIDPQGKLNTLEGFRTVATMDMPAQGVSMKITSVQRRPDHIAVSMTIPGLGEMKQGYDGTNAWSVDPMQGPRLLSDAEKTQLTDGADFKAMQRDPSLITKTEAAGEATVNGEATDCVAITWKSARVTTECFSRTSGLLLEMRAKSSTPQGEIETVTRMSDYKPVGGVLMAHKIAIEAMGMQQSITFTETEAGPMPASAFEPPAEVKALIKKP